VLPRDQDAQARPAGRTPLQVERKAADALALAFAQQPLEFGLAPQPALRIETETLGGGRRWLKREAAAAARAAIAQNLSSAGRAAAHEKAMSARAPGFRRLVSPLGGHRLQVRKRALLERARECDVKSEKSSRNAVDNPGRRG